MPNINQMPFTASDYYAEMVEIRNLIKVERSKYAGISEIENNDDRLRLDDRIKKLWEEFYKVKEEYQEACRIEEGRNPRPSYMRTYFNGS